MMLSSVAAYILILINYNSKIDKKNIISKLAPCSFGIYLIHGIFLDITNKLINLSSINSLLGVPLISLVLFIVSYFVIKYLRKISFIEKYLM